ncbi:SixA phosphatase family protein [Mycoplana ramosa]|uniref:SixA phosphatase family protein n=1 Tax=Mycoplana ramosa TaxID=40837 RepID=A0ABW3YUA4_MYCRA
MATATSGVFRLYLLRHARAGWAEPGKSDFDRTLDDQGYAEAEILAEEMADQGYRPQVVISSTAVRCRETAEPLKRTLGEELPIEYVDTLYGGSINAYAEVAFADRAETSVMIVGHNPTIEEFFRRVVGLPVADTAAPAGFPTAALATIDFDRRPTDRDFSGGRLSCFITPHSGL